MQVKWGYKASKAFGPEDIFQRRIKRLESEGPVTKAAISYSKIKEDQGLSNIKALKIWPDITLTGDGISQYHSRVIKRNRVAQAKTKKEKIVMSKTTIFPTRTAKAKWF